jgi:cytochrome c oxidase subunit 2
MFGAALLSLPGSGARAAAPLQYLSGAGDKAAPVVSLTWGVLIISLVVIAAISLLLIAAIWHRPSLTLLRPGERAEVGRDVGGLNWLWIGVGLSTVVLLVTIVWTVIVLARVQTPGTAPTITIEVTGRQWWWQVRYISDDPARIFSTANEIHIPAGQPVRFKLIGGDVIHSFWVPALGGKMDAIPGQTNETWLEAAAPGTFSGQCTEYCGLQHAHMGFLVIADTPARFRAWWDHQLQSPAPEAAAMPGADIFENHCGSCHTVRGTDAAGSLGPDLSHLMQRTTLASGMLPNDPGTLTHWINDPQSLKPGALMPAPELTSDQLTDIHAYLKMLR